MKHLDNYILVTWWWDDMGDYPKTFERSFDFIKDKQLNDIKGLMKSYGVKRWVKDPHLVTERNYKDGDGCLIEFRNVSIKPIKIVESWSYKPEVMND